MCLGALDLDHIDIAFSSSTAIRSAVYKPPG
jgi:hypothetical protein